MFNLIAICNRALKKSGLKEQANEMTKRVTSSKSYDDALAIMMEYVDPVDVNYEMYDDFDNYDRDICI